MNKINWTVRFKNPMFWVQVVISVFVPILTYFGLEASDLTTWHKLFELLGQALSNPYVVVMIGVSLFNTVVDPVTRGFGDSEKALTYKVPVKDSKSKLSDKVPSK